MPRLTLLVVSMLLVACAAAGTPATTTPPGTAAPTDAAALAPSVAPVASAVPAAPTASTQASADAAPTLQASAPAAPGEHPRLWLTPASVTRLRGWATASNPLWAESVQPLAERAKEDMDQNLVPDQDCGQRAYEAYNTESYAELFAFMSLIAPDAAARADYAARARTLLMHIMDAAALGPASERSFRCSGDPETPVYPPFRDPIFFTEDSDRLRWHGEAFPLTVDWIYPSLSAADKATIRTVFTRWGGEIINAGYHHPEPVGMVNNPALTANRSQVRWAGNNYFAAHMRNLGMLALALDPADSNPTLQGYLNNATGAWLYLFDEALRTDTRGGLLPEGFEYSPQTASYAIQFLLALQTAGAADPVRYGPAVVLANQPFWDDFVTSYIHSLSPATLDDPERGATYQPAWYGDAQHYRLSDFIDAFGALGVYDQQMGNTTRLATLRWLQRSTAPGGAARFIERARGADYFRSTVLYFMLFDPAVAPTADPRDSMPRDFVAPGLQHVFSRTDWSADASWFNYALSWNSIDHQHADGNHFEWYRKGEWLTKARTGYANIAEGIASSEFRNSVAIQNARPVDRSDDDWRIDLWRRGSQWNLVSNDNPPPPVIRFDPAFTYISGDATSLYNSTNEGSTLVQEATRALVWLEPDYMVVYDRAATTTPAGFKRWWLQLPRPATISGNQARMTTAGGQQLAVTSLLPRGATLSVPNRNDDNIGETVATAEPMRERLMVQAPAGARAHFLHVLQGADAGATLTTPLLLSASEGTFEGAVVQNTAVLFPITVGQPVTTLTYTVPAATQRHIITGLTPGAGFTMTRTANAGSVTLTLQAGGSQMADASGVLTLPSTGASGRVYLPFLRQ